MTSVLKRLRGAGLVLGVIGGAVLGGFLAQRLGRDSVPDRAAGEAGRIHEGFFKANALHATASNSQESLIMATGEVDSGLEAIYVLDGLTGELRGGLINVNTRKFTIGYTYKQVLQDLEANNVKNPKFVMVTGELPLIPRRTKMNRCSLYIAEVNSGWVAAYSAPWDNTAYTNRQTASVPLVLLDKFKFRDAALRPQ